MARRLKVTVLLSDAEMTRLQAAADQVGVELSLYLRSAALNAAREVTIDRKRTYSREQLMSIHRRATLKGHQWTEEDLREQGLPLYWCEAWVRARLDQGYTRAQLAVESGHPEKAVTAYLRRVYGLGVFEQQPDERQRAVRAALASGKSRDEIARELGLSVKTVSGYARQMPGEIERQFHRVVEAVGEWPATRADIAQAAFKGNGPAASEWLRKKIKRGWMQRTERGRYGLLEGAPSHTAQSDEAT